ncbi:hypothetical protein KDK_72480 [Dictyobacter kobayashii]|uniref:Uncharacterized protein n=1 Tax=Dictyobacter kobayashii TaxID=2014872 RepID=A0A402AWI7_9CHLR|nr:hypothetical protein KDK_72480 [Dictyobacter kobayashii]
MWWTAAAVHHTLHTCKAPLSRGKWGISSCGHPPYTPHLQDPSELWQVGDIKLAGTHHTLHTCKAPLSRGKWGISSCGHPPYTPHLQGSSEPWQVGDIKLRAPTTHSTPARPL